MVNTIPIITKRSEPELELLVTPIRPGARNVVRGETIKLVVPAALFNSADGIWRLGRALAALIERRAER